MLRTLLTKILILIWFIAITPFLFASLITRRTARGAMSIAAGVGLFIARMIVGVKYEIIGEVPKSGIVASKHMSMMETGIMLVDIPNSFIMLKKELMYIPVYGWLFWRAGMLPVNRSRANIQNLNQAAQRELDKGRVMVIFPEGTRVKPGAGTKIKRGILHIAEYTKQPIIPVGLNTGVYWPKKGIMKPGTAKVYFEKPLPYDATLEQITESIQKHSA
ncbi:MAG: 1-acyl-sn-glycerol-3-phosphate acyltransferase [Alphaproteobacteria bacterium]|nr:1-acyl-sn-glycerol-3-phosphate acyltransferase [Alphaproteobacteria bacterium]